jgi:glycosyltransferase involved in cell wall biosynthesis
MLNIVAPINSLGYGVAGYNIFREILKTNPTAALFPISQPEFYDEYVSRGMSNRWGYHKYRPTVKIWHQNDLHTSVGKGTSIGFPIFELTEFSKEEILSINYCDKIFTCSSWAKEIISEVFNGEIDVVPLGVNLDIFKPATSKRESTIFFNCGKWEKRKGHDILLECFNLAFDHSDNVELWMMCDNPFIGDANNKWIELYKRSPLGHKIRIIPRQKTHEDVYNIMKQADCGVFPARAEGWNLELLEMMACGKQVIATNYSAHTEFCNKDNCHLVEIERLENAYDGVFFSGSHGQWASFSDRSKEHFIENMRLAHKNKQSNNEYLNQAGITTAEKFTWQNSARSLLNGI